MFAALERTFSASLAVYQLTPDAVPRSTSIVEAWAGSVKIATDADD